MHIICRISLRPMYDHAVFCILQIIASISVQFNIVSTLTVDMNIDIAWLIFLTV